MAETDFAQIVVDQWKHYEATYEFHLDAYCVLPEHYHTVLNVGVMKTISQILHAVHSYTATLINKQLDQITKIKVWEGNAWDEVVRSEEMYWQKIAYTLFNPWRAGMVQDPFELYPSWLIIKLCRAWEPGLQRGDILSAEAAPGEASRSPSTELVLSTGEVLRTFGTAEWACRRFY